MKTNTEHFRKSERLPDLFGIASVVLFPLARREAFVLYNINTSPPSGDGRGRIKVFENGGLGAKTFYKKFFPQHTSAERASHRTILAHCGARRTS